MEDNKKDEKEYYIIYFDILGYKQYFEENDNHQQLLYDIIRMFDDIKIRTDIYKDISKKEIKVRAFSDNMVICVEDKKDTDLNIFLLGYLVANFQAAIFRKYGLLLRGSFTKGKFYIGSNIVYGEGLINAVTIESLAKYPRIILDTDTIKYRSEDDEIKVFNVDNDGKVYLDYFKDNHIKDKFDILKEMVCNRIKKYGKYNPTVKDENKIKVYESIIQKTLWVVEKFNEACDAIGKPEEKIDYKVTINKRLLKMELSLAEKA